MKTEQIQKIRRFNLYYLFLLHSPVFTFTFQLMCTWIARCLMQLNSCVNPFIYAAILPEFKNLVTTRFSGSQVSNPRSRPPKPSSNLSKQDSKESEAPAKVVLRKSRPDII